jgi:hypothetical protein
MKRIVITAAALFAVIPASLGLISNASFAHSIPVHVPARATATLAHRESTVAHIEAGDDKGSLRTHAEAGDDKGSLRPQTHPGDDTVIGHGGREAGSEHG